MKVILTTTALLLFSAMLAAAFSPQQPVQSRCVYTQQPRTITFAVEGEMDVVAEEDTIAETEEVPKVAVKCPDCDLCDGSGR